MRNPILHFSPQTEIKEDILYDALQQTLPDIAWTSVQLVACRVWRGGHCSKEKLLVKALQVCKLDYDTQFGLLRTVLPLSSASCESCSYPNSLWTCCVAQHTYYLPRLHSRDRNSQNVLLYSMIFKNLYYEPYIKVLIIHVQNSQAAKSWFSHFLACQKYSSFFPYHSYWINIFQYLPVLNTRWKFQGKSTFGKVGAIIKPSFYVSYLA